MSNKNETISLESNILTGN